MKKMLCLALAVILLLCGCQFDPEQTVSLSRPNLNDLPGGIVSSPKPNQSDESVDDDAVVEKYVARDSYDNISLGYKNLHQNEKYYYYSDEFGFFAVDKQTKEQIAFSEKLMLGMCVFQDKIYFPQIGKVVVFDTNTHKFEEKSYKELLSLQISVPQTKYNLSILMIKDGWLVSVEDNEWGTKKVYLTDYNFTTKTLLPITRFDFVLDDDIFLLDKSGNVLCYNYNTKKRSYVTDNFNITQDEYSFLATRNFTYLGKDRILVYAEDKLHVVSLKDGSTCLEFPFKPEDPTSVFAEAIYDDKNAYLFIGMPEDSYTLYSIPHSDNKAQTIYQTKIDLPVTYCGPADIDENYIYLDYLSYYDEEGNPLSYYSRINKDGTGEETIFKAKIPDSYLYK